MAIIKLVGYFRDGAGPIDHGPNRHALLDAVWPWIAATDGEQTNAIHDCVFCVGDLMTYTPRNGHPTSAVM